MYQMYGARDLESIEGPRGSQTFMVFWETGNSLHVVHMSKFPATPVHDQTCLYMRDTDFTF